MDKPEVEAIQDAILMEQLTSTDAAIDVTRSRYLRIRRAQVITLTSLHDLDIVIGLVKSALNQDTYDWYAPLRPAEGGLFFTFIPARLIALIDRGFLQKLLLLASSGFQNIKAVRAADIRGHVRIASPPKHNKERIQIMYRLSKEYVAFLETKGMKLTLSTTVLRMNSASKAAERAAAIELQTAAADELKTLKI